MNTIITYIEERINRLEKVRDKNGFTNDIECQSRYCLAYGGITELQAVLNKIKETSWN